MKLVVFVLLLLLVGCASGPQIGSPEYIENQVFQCRKLCANGEVNIAQIKGLDCVCGKPQQPVIYNPIVTGINPIQNSVPQNSYTPPTSIPVVTSPPVQTPSNKEPTAPDPRPSVVAPSTASPNLEVKPDAAVVKDAVGRMIYSQVK